MITLNQLKAEKCRREFFYFIKEFWQNADTSVPVWNWHIEYLAKELQEDAEILLNKQSKKNDIILNCPPGTSKSMIVSILLPAWLLAKDTKTKILTASYSKTIAIELSQKSRNLMMSDKFKNYFPYCKLSDDDNTKSNYKTEDGGGRFITSTGSNILGVHADIIICDDIQNLDVIHSEQERKSVNEWVSGTLSTRKTDKLNSLMIFVQQRLHRLDITSYLLQNGNHYKHIVLPAEMLSGKSEIKPAHLIMNYREGLLDVNRLNLRALQILKNDLGTKNYNAQMLQNPDSSEDSIIKEKWLNIIDNQPIEKPEYEYFLDTAYGGSKADYNVILECFKYNNCLYITNVYRNQFEFPELIKEIVKVCRGNKLHIEGKASGKSIIQQLKNSTNFNIIELQPNGDKLSRLNAISPTVEGGRIYLIKNQWNYILIQEVCLNYPQHDDVRDCFTYAVSEKIITGNNYGQYYIK